ncbi:hypothetical protein J6U76_04235 [bacterium]|nr:hypothetical protein [bacterium]
MFSYGRMKRYGDSGYYEIMSCSRPLFRMPGWERRQTKIDAENEFDNYMLRRLGWLDDSGRAGGDSRQPDPEKARDNLARAARRAAVAVRDLAMSNDFSWFVTLTLDQEKIDRYDIGEITKKLNRWLSNLVQRFGLRYVLVAERHKDGAIHFHGLVNDVPGFIPSGTWIVPGRKKPMRPRSKRQLAEWQSLGDASGYHEVFNWERWPLGFSTGIRLYGDYDRAVGYVTKYIKKQISGDEGAKIGGRWYYSGGELERPSVYYVQVDTEWMKENCPGAFFFGVDAVKAEFGIFRAHDSAPAEFLSGETEFTKAGK